MNATGGFFENEWMQQLFQFSALTVVDKDQLAHFFSVECAFPSNEFITKQVVYCWYSGTVGLRQFMRNLVGINHINTQFHKNFAGAGFAATDASCQANN